MNLADRVRTIVAPAPRVDRPDLPRATAASQAGTDLESTLGGEWREGCFVVERRVDPATPLGHMSIGGFATAVGGAAEAPLLANDPAARGPLMFFDVETTGLSGGAGTYVFLVGCGWFDEHGAFVTRQYFLVQFSGERQLLGAVSAELGGAGALVSFNGKSFDGPVLEMRCLFHRMNWVGAQIPHIDVLHAARRFWGPRSRSGESAAIESCSLTALERQVLGSPRGPDVFGYDVPGRYFQFVRSGDAGPIAAVLEHNRLDLVALAGLTSRLLELVRRGPEAACDSGEAVALGHLYTRASQHARALSAYERAAVMCGEGHHRVDAFRSLALAYRRARRFEEAAGWWQRILELDGCPCHIAREASEALAIHHEHRIRDLAAAKMFALRSLQHGTHPRAIAAVRHRLARIDSRIEKQLRSGARSCGGEVLSFEF